ncbi:MAG: T9SS type A sorting domain-containing protein [Ignavibacteriales bacterium]|nr:MAG: T9SS type A sorting domain-containing protein [Ignavibacteriales bacterium]
MKKNLLLYFLFVGLLSGFFYLQTGEHEFTSEDFQQHRIEKKKARLNLKYDQPDKAMKWFYDQRAYPNGFIPERWQEEAMEHILLHNQSPASNPAALNWTQLGPGNIGGRIRAIAVHPSDPNTVYIGAVAGGVWKTVNGGTTWTPLTDFMENIAVCALVIDPDNPNTIYAGTGEGFFNGDAIRGAGIFKSVDAGATWSRLSATDNSDYYYVTDLDYDNTNNVLYASTRKGLYSSNNGGSSFTTHLSGTGGSDVHCTDIEIAYTSPVTVYAAFGLFDQSQIWRSTNAGSTFEFNYGLTGAGRIELAVSKSNPLVAYASFMDLSTNGTGAMAYTNNGGGSWSARTVPGPSYAGQSTYTGSQAWYDNILAVDPDNANNVLAGGIDNWKSTNSGNNWTQKTNWYSEAGAPPYAHADQHGLAFAPSNSSIVYLGNDGGIYRSNNKGETWTSLNNDLFITQFFYGTTASSGTIYAGGTQDNGTLKSTGGTAWNEILGGDGGATEIDFNNPNNIYMEYVNLAFFKTTNGGATFFKAMTGIPTGPNFYDGTTDRTQFISPFSMDPNDANTIVAGTYRVWRTQNGASNWSAISTDLTGDGSGQSGATISAVTVAKGNSGVIYAGCSNGRVQVTTNGGTNWNLRNSGLPNLSVTKIATDPNNPAVAYVTFSGYQSGSKIFKTDNYGQSWSNISGNLPNLPANCVAVNHSNGNNIFVGTDLGVFSTENGGSSWVQDVNGMANVPVLDLDLRASDNKLFAATHGRSMYSATIGGGGGGTQTTLMQQGFDQAFPPAGWTTQILNSSYTWQQGNPQNNNFNQIDPSSTNSAICPWVAQNQNEWLISPAFELGNGSAYVEFYAAYSTQWLSAATLKLHVSTNGGSNWQEIWSAENDGQGFMWRQKNVDLTAYSNRSNLKLGWQYVGNDGDLVGLDGIKIVGFPTSVEEIDSEIPETFDLSFNYPNPFNPSTKFRYALPEARNVKVIIYNINGEKVTELVNNYQNAGTYEITWNGKNDLNQEVASGTYIYSVVAGDFSQTRKMVLLK